MRVDLSSFLFLEQSLATQQQVLMMTLMMITAPRMMVARMRTRVWGQTVSSQWPGSSQYSHEAGQARPQSREARSEVAESCLMSEADRNVL